MPPTDINERTYPGDIIRQELPNYASRKLVTILSGQVLSCGAVLGAVLLAAAAAVAFAGNTGNGAMGAIVVGDGAKQGDYKLVCIEPAANAGKFQLEDPDGIIVGVVTVGVAFDAGGLAFTLADGAADFIAGDGFTITVAAGSGKYKLAPAAAADGSDAGAAILLQDVDATDGDVDNVVVLYRDAQVSTAYLTYDATADDDNKKAALRAGLEANRIDFLSFA